MDKAILDEVVQSALRKAYRWQTPCHWNTSQWREELVGVAYLAALQAGGEYDPARGLPIQPFLLQRTLSALLTYYRREWKFGSQCIPLVTTSPEGDEPDAQSIDLPDPQSNDFVEQICASEDVRCALRSLTIRERQVVVMVFWDGMSERAIAQTLGFALSTVCVYKERALRKLRRALGFAR